MYKAHRSVAELCDPNISAVFFSHLDSGGFPHLIHRNDPNLSENQADQDDADFGLTENHVEENRLQQDDYQWLMNYSRTRSSNSFLLGIRELDLAYTWPQSWHGFSFEHLLSWIKKTKDNIVLQSSQSHPVDISSFSVMQQKAYNLVHKHTFGSHQDDQLLMLVLGTAGTGKSFLINAIDQLFKTRDCSQCLKITAPTGIAAANIQGSTIYSLIPLLQHSITRHRLHSLQMMMMDVKLLIIDEYSFLSVAIIDKLDQHLRKIFPRKSNVPFGGLNILLCGDPAQLPPVNGKPLYAYQGSSSHLAARFHLFDKVVELDHVFRQSGNDQSQIKFRNLLTRVANCEASEDDWRLLQTRRPSCLSKEDNNSFDVSKFIVSTNDARHQINHDKLSKFSPVIKITDCDGDVTNIDDDSMEAEHVNPKNPQLYAVGAEVMLTANLWTEVGLVNGACGTVVAILKPEDNRKLYVLMVDIPSYHGPALSPSHPTIVPITHMSTLNFSGIPLTLAWAITIHKSQGMTLERVTIDLGDTEFSSGLTFVALSRAKTFHGLRIMPFDFDRYARIANGTHVNARRAEMQRLRLLAKNTIG